MVSIREDINLEKNKFEDILDYNIFELLQGYWCYGYKTRNEPKFKYYCWETNFTKALFGSALEKKWTKNLPCLRLVMDKISEQNKAFNPTFCYNTEANFEKLLKMAKKLRKKTTSTLSENEFKAFHKQFFCKCITKVYN